MYVCLYVCMYSGSASLNPPTLLGHRVASGLRMPRGSAPWEGGITSGLGAVPGLQELKSQRMLGGRPKSRPVSWGRPPGAARLLRVPLQPFWLPGPCTLAKTACEVKKKKVYVYVHVYIYVYVYVYVYV